MDTLPTMIRAISPVAIHIVLVALPSLTLVACGGDAGPTELGGESFVQIHIRIEGEGAFHALNDTLAASLVGADGEGTFRQIQQTRATWRSLDRGVAVIEDDSLVISRSVGTARIVATFSELSDTVEVTVVQVPAFLEINFERDTVLFGDSLALRHAVLDSNRVALPAAVVEWSSNDPAVAAVDAGGLVRGVGPGLARVEAAHGSLVAHGRVEVLPPFVTVSAGGGHTCGLLEGGAAYCWGAALRGQTGVGGFWNQFNRPEPVAGELEFTQLDAGDQHTCALDQGGVAYCWGWNEHGQLGVEDRADRDVPTLVDTELRFSEIRAGRRITCGVSVDGVMFCWGRVQLEEEAPPAEGIQPILEGLVFARVDVGYDHGCGLATTGEIYCWGDEWVWEWGGNVTPEPRLASEGSSFASLTTGGMLCGVLLGGGGQCLGDVDDNGQGEWHVVEGDPGFTSFDAAPEHVCGLVGAVAHCWGNNYRGQLGNGTRNTIGWDWSGPPEAVVGGYVFEKLSSGGRHTCAIWEGQPLCWGSNGSGQLGNIAPPETCTDSIDPCTARPIRVTRARLLW